MKQRGQMWLLWPKQAGSPARDDSSDRSLRGRHRRPVDRPGVGPARAARGRAGPARLGAGGRSRPLPPARLRDLPGQPAVPGRPGRLGRHARRPADAGTGHGDLRRRRRRGPSQRLAGGAAAAGLDRRIGRNRARADPGRAPIRHSWIEDRCAGYANGEIQTENGPASAPSCSWAPTARPRRCASRWPQTRGGAVQGHWTGGAPGRRTAAPGHRRSVVPRRRRAGAAAAAGHVRRRAGVDGLVHARRGRGAAAGLAAGRAGRRAGRTAGARGRGPAGQVDGAQQAAWLSADAGTRADGGAGHRAGGRRRAPPASFGGPGAEPGPGRRRGAGRGRGRPRTLPPGGRPAGAAPLPARPRRAGAGHAPGHRWPALQPPRAPRRWPGCATPACAGSSTRR